MCKAVLKSNSRVSLLKTLRNLKKADVMWELKDQLKKKKTTTVIDYNDVKTATIIHRCVCIWYTHTHTHQWLLG